MSQAKFKFGKNVYSIYKDLKPYKNYCKFTTNKKKNNLEASQVIHIITPKIILEDATSYFF